jgi:hypothetical protein
MEKRLASQADIQEIKDDRVKDIFVIPENQISDAVNEILSPRFVYTFFRPTILH